MLKTLLTNFQGRFFGIFNYFSKVTSKADLENGVKHFFKDDLEASKRGYFSTIILSISFLNTFSNGFLKAELKRFLKVYPKPT